MNWYESPDLEHMGMIENGYHSIYEFEVYRHRITGELSFCDHDDPDSPLSLDDIKDFFTNRKPNMDPSLKEQMLDCGIKI